MRETSGDLWQLVDQTPGAWVIVPTNGVVQRDGRLVMGAGVAGDAQRRHPDLAATLGAHVAKHGNVPALVSNARVISWPTKPDRHLLDEREHPGWMCAARIRRPECERQVARLVWANAPRVVASVDHGGLDGPIFLPHVGCGLGGLSWAKVGPALAGVLDDRFVAVAPR